MSFKWGWHPSLWQPCQESTLSKLSARNHLRFDNTTVLLRRDSFEQTTKRVGLNLHASPSTIIITDALPTSIYKLLYTFRTSAPIKRDNGIRLRALAVDQPPAPWPLNGGLTTEYRLRLRRPARPHGQVHSQVRRLHRARPQARPRRKEPVPHERRRAAR